MAGGGSSIIGGGGGGVIEGPPEAGQTANLADSSLRFCPLYLDDKIFHAGITWTFTEKVTWGRYVSGEPWVLVTGAGITVSSIEPGLTLATGYTANTPPGVTFWINCSVKNPNSGKFKKFYLSYDNWYGLTYITEESIVDQRLSANFVESVLGGENAIGLFNGMTFNYEQLALLPIGLTSGDVLISNHASVDSRNNEYLTNSNSFPFCAKTLSNRRAGIYSRAALTAVGIIPDCDEFRPPYHWPAAQRKNRPRFTETNMVNNPQNHILNITGYRDLIGYTLSNTMNGWGPTYSGLVQDWNTRLSQSMKTPMLLTFQGLAYQSTANVMSVIGDNVDLETYGPEVRKNNLWLNFYSIFAPWVPANLRLLAQRRIMQYAIDAYGWAKDGGRWQQQGGHLQGFTNPYIRFLGWVYNDPLILNYEHYTNGITLGYINSRMTSGNGSPKNLINSQQLLMGVFGGADEYHQINFVYGLGETGAGRTAFIITNPNIGLTHNYGLCGGASPPQLRNAPGATGVGWTYKYSGITLNSVNPASTVYSARIFNASGGHNQDSGVVYTGQFGVLNFCQGFRPRNKNTVFDNKSPHIGELNCDESRSYKGLIIKIVSGTGAGDTEYRILEASGFDIQKDLTLPYNCSVVLDRPFQNGTPDANSVIDMYPWKANDNYPLNATSNNSIFSTGFGVTGAVRVANRSHFGHQSPDYVATLQPQIIVPYTVLKYLGITQDNEYIINYYHNMLFTDKYPLYAKHRGLGTADQRYGLRLGNQFSKENLYLLAMKYMWGASGDYIGVMTKENCGASGTSYPPLLSTTIADDLLTYTYTVSEVSYETKTGEMLEGLGVVYDNPVTPYRIKAIIGNNIVINKSSYTFIDYAEFTEQFGYPSLFINGNKARLLLNSNVIVDGVIPFIYEDDVTPPSLGTQVSYTLTDGYSYTQHSVQTLLPSSGISGAQYVTSTLPISQMFRRRNILSFNVFGIPGKTYSYYDEDAQAGVTGSDGDVEISIAGQYGYINIGGNVNSVDDWSLIDISQNMGTYTIDISNVPNNDLLGAPLNLRFFTSPINVFEYEIGQTIKYIQNENVYSKF